jgi:hypothetical protein
LTSIEIGVTLKANLQAPLKRSNRKKFAMPLNPAHSFSVTFLDYSKEKSTAKGNMGAITIGTLAGFLTQFGTLKSTMQALSLGTLIQDSWTGDTTQYSSAPPTDLNAQRERKWRVDYEDVVNLGKHQFEIPVALVTGQLVSNTDLANIETAEWVAFIAAFEAMVKSPDGNAVNVLGARLVGRNL